MTKQAQKARLAQALKAHQEGGPYQAVREAYSVYAGGTYGLDYAGLMIAARTLVECATLKRGAR